MCLVSAAHLLDHVPWSPAESRCVPLCPRLSVRPEPRRPAGL